MSSFLKTLRNGIAKIFSTGKNFTNGIMARSRKRRSGPRLSNSAIKWAKSFGKGTMKLLKNRSPLKLLKNRSPLKLLMNRSPQKLLKNRSPQKLLKNMGNAFKGTQKLLTNLSKTSLHRGKKGSRRAWFQDFYTTTARPTPYGVHLTPAAVHRASAKLQSELKRVRQLSKSTQKNRR